jgi:hypothetical protein
MLPEALLSCHVIWDGALCLSVIKIIMPESLLLVSTSMSRSLISACLLYVQRARKVEEPAAEPVTDDVRKVQESIKSILSLLERGAPPEGISKNRNLIIVGVYTLKTWFRCHVHNAK